MPSFWSNNTVYFGSKDHFVYALHYFQSHEEPITEDDDTADGGSGGGGDGKRDEGSGNDQLSASSISGIAIGCLVGALAAVGLGYWMRKNDVLVSNGCIKEKKKPKPSLW